MMRRRFLGLLLPKGLELLTRAVHLLVRAIFHRTDMLRHVFPFIIDG